MLSEQRLEAEERVDMSSGDSCPRQSTVNAEALKWEHGWHVFRTEWGPLCWGGVSKGEGSRILEQTGNRESDQVRDLVR